MPLRVLAFFTAITFGSVAAFAQPLVNVQTPLISAQDDFYEQFGTSWGAHGKNWFFNWGAPPPVPAFGGFDPAAQLQGGFALAAPGFGGHLNFTAGQGSTRTITGVAPSVTVMNGQYGRVFDGRTRPFVTQIIPVVAENPIDRHLRLHGPPQVRDSSEEEESLANQTPQRAASAPASIGGPSSAERGDKSVAEIRREQEELAAAEKAEFAALVAQAEAVAANEKFSEAATLYTKAAVRSQGQDRERYLALAKEMRLRAKQSR